MTSGAQIVGKIFALYHPTTARTTIGIGSNDRLIAIEKIPQATVRGARSSLMPPGIVPPALGGGNAVSKGATRPIRPVVSKNVPTLPVRANGLTGTRAMDLIVIVVDATNFALLLSNRPRDLQPLSSGSGTPMNLNLLLRLRR